MSINTTNNNELSSVVAVTKIDDTMNENLDFVNLCKYNFRQRADVVKLGEICLL